MKNFLKIVIALTSLDTISIALILSPFSWGTENLPFLGGMATTILCYSSPAAVTSAVPGTTSLGFSRFLGAVTKPSLGVAPVPSKRLFRIHCQQLEQQQQQNPVVIPREQRWMFEESEINGPVLSLTSHFVQNILIDWFLVLSVCHS